MENAERPVAIDSEHLCARCGCRIPPEGAERHEVWHDFVESGIAELVAAVALLEARAPD